MPAACVLQNSSDRKATVMKKKHLVAVAVTASVMLTGGCTAIAVVDAAASTAIGAGKLAVKGTTAAVGAVIPDGDEKKKKK